MTLLSLVGRMPTESLSWDDPNPQSDVLTRDHCVIVEIPPSAKRDARLIEEAMHLGMSPSTDRVRVFVADGITVALWF